MGRHDVAPDLTPEAIREFTKALLQDVRALEAMLERGMFETGARKFGAEQEMFLVDGAGRAAMVAVDVLQQLDDPTYTTELALFNLEANLDPLLLRGDCFRTLEARVGDAVQRARDAAQPLGANVVLTGILPSLHKSDLSIDNITPRPRYYALNEALTQMRGGSYRLHIEGIDEIHLEQDSVMLEACNTSFQVHLQVSPDEFAHFYNVAQAVAGPVLAAAVNSPLLFGRRLWHETRVALFQQSVDTRTASPHLRELSPRVRFGERWIRESVLEAFQEDIARFRVIMGQAVTEDPFEALARGEPPELGALQLHNSTVYRWNRPCYGAANGRAHLRIECRLLPAGPSVVDEIANAVFWIGLMLGAAAEHRQLTEHLEFDEAKANFLAAARLGLRAGFTWIDHESVSAPVLVRERLLPLAAEGLRAAQVDAGDVEHYLGIVARRVETGRTGARWLLKSLTHLRDRCSRAECLGVLTAATIARQAEGRPCHEWELADRDETRSWRHSYSRVEQYMTTELFTVREDELVDLAAFLMDRKGLRHVLVEDHQHRLVGIISYRSLIRLLAHRGPEGIGPTVPVRDIMEADPITITPETSTLQAVELMRSRRISALPVVKNDKLVGMVSERNFLELAADLLAEKFGSDD